MTTANDHNINKKDKQDSWVGALHSFKTMMSSLGNSYEGLKDRIHELNVEMTEENRTLQEHFYEANRLRHFFDSILNSMNDGVIVVDTTGHIVYFSDGAIHMTGYAKNDVLGKPYLDIFKGVVSQRFSPIHTLMDGKPLLMEEKQMSTRTGTMFPVRYSTSRVTDHQDRILGAVEVFSDLRHIRTLEEKLQAIKTQHALTDMAGLMAHEIRNPLGGIRGYVDLMAESIPEDSEMIGMIENVRGLVKRLDEIVTNFSLLTRPVKPNIIEINVLDFLKNVIKFFQQELGEVSDFIAVNVNAQGLDGVVLHSDPILLQQAITAVLDNAVKSMEEGGTIRLHVKPEHGEMLIPGGRIQIVATDSGPGMDEVVLKKIFTPFFTTREKGLGLGLTLARNYISLIGGEIFAESQSGMGTSITMLVKDQRGSA